MKEESSFPTWTKNTLMGIGAYSLLLFINTELSKYIPFVALIYPIILLVILQYEKHSEEKGQGKGIYFYNISLSIIAFLTIILLINYKTYVENAGTLIIGENRIFLTNNFILKIIIYIVTVFYLVISGFYLSYRIKFWIESYEGIGAFKKGQEIWKNLITPLPQSPNITNLSEMYMEAKRMEALKYFDLAIKNKYTKPEVFSLRASCLNDLGFYYDAIEDFNRAIESNPEKGIANNYFMRSLVKDSIFDFEESFLDINEAVRLSKLDNDDNAYWNGHAKKTIGYKTATEFYEWHLDMIKTKIDREKKYPTDRINEIRKLKRR
jgi:tetratricopeptide (TPR) repeat protein